MSHPLGRYRWNPTVLFAVGLASMIVLLTAPTFLLKGADISEDSEKIEYDDFDDAPSDFFAPMMGTGTILAGSIVTMIGGLFLLLLGYVPTTTAVARFGGWVCGVIAGIGALLLITASFSLTGWSVGSAFSMWMADTGYMGVQGATLWAVSPVICAALGAAAMFAVLNLLPRLAPTVDGLRDHATDMSKMAGVITAVLALGAMLPWVLMQDGSTNPFTEEEGGTYFVSLMDISMSFTAFPSFDGLESFGKMLFAAAWIGVLSIWLQQLTLMLPRGQTEVAAKGVSASLDLVNSAIFVALAIFYLNAISWLYHPGWGEAAYSNDTYMPGWFNFALIPFLVFWGIGQWRNAQEGFTLLREWADLNDATPKNFDA